MLDNALDCGITEFDFWNMTIAELERAVESKNRVIQREAKQRATFDYIHALLIGKALAKTMSSSATFPEIYEAYPTLFDDVNGKEKQQEQKAQLSALRFIKFAQSHNQNFKGGGAKE